MFYKKRGPKETGELLAELFHDAFSAEKFHFLFDSELLDHHNQSVDMALAEWYALGAFSFVLCLWRVYDSKDKVFSILDSFEPAVMKLLLLNDATRTHFLEVARDREIEYVDHYKGKDGTDLQRFYGRVVSHIIGTFDAEMDAMGLHLAPADTCAAICHYHTGVMRANMDAIVKTKG